jgi:hypothetical protein
MAFVNDEAYDKNHEFTQDELAPMAPADIGRWMCQQAYGTPEPSPEVNPTKA